MVKLIKTSALMLALSSLLLGCSEQKVTEEPAIEVLTVSTMALKQTEQYTVPRTYAGIVKSGQQANLGFELSGKIFEIYVDVGDSVSKGQPLIRLDTDLLMTEASQLQAQHEEVQAQLSLVAANLKRQRSLKSKGFSAESEIDSLTSQQRVLEANLLRTKATIKANELKQTKSTILAPYSGTVAKRFVSLGDVVSVGAPTFRLLASENKEAFIGIPAQQVEKITALETPSIRVGEVTHAVHLLNPGAMVDTQSRSVGLRYEFPSKSVVLEGQLAYLSYGERIDEQGYWVPLTALIDGLRGVWNVFIVGDSNIVERRSVQVLFADNKHAYVQGAIEDGEHIISSGLHRVVPGQVVSASEKIAVLVE